MLTQAQIDALKTTLQANFDKGLVNTPSNWKMIARLMKSTSKSSTYAWLTKWPSFRKWVGARLHKAIAEKAYTVTNDKYEATIDVQRTDVEDDDFGHYATVAYGHGEAAARLMDEIIFSALLAGWSTNCYDDQFFFDTDHPVYPNTDGTGTPVSTSNIQAGAGAPWYLFAPNAPALILQERVPAKLESQTDGNSSTNVFENDVFSFGGRWRGAAAYGFWQCCYGSKATLDATNFADLYNRMLSQVGDGGIKLGTVPTLLVCGPTNRVAAENLLLRDRLATGETNINYKKVDLLVTPWVA
ncbi:Mu-like prophage major head subunit gpT family protein [Methylomonas rapida]|uniref:Mu-like prophage major head subunit gpT family protein n=1 Tax=Methylomonas rapida TaxID=2963939 RepID=A0ABY7GLT7_9GAMM|nr:Mu-like prophage major head subunit gpT family protein [Methylomonas rapida]WAR43605.1 Mu-like prophage major head subunit gpT family protein [Methylomonas rapida]WAR45476.1 Mu-like prophage major head subunit gpT family protein [Methylomonas rapida]